MAALFFIHAVLTFSSAPRLHTAHSLRAHAPRHSSHRPLMLEGTQWTIELDVGPERGTWCLLPCPDASLHCDPSQKLPFARRMPPAWGASGARATPKVRVEFAPEGKLILLETGVYDRQTVRWESVGGWSLEAQRDAVQFWLAHQGLERDDVVLEPGKMWFSAPAWGRQLSKRGNLTIKQKKLGWLPFLPTFKEGSFMVGTFKTAAVEDGTPPLGA
jgi:hypothetical protein